MTSHGRSTNASAIGSDNATGARSNLSTKAPTKTAILTDGTRWSGDLLVGADGIHSRIRQLVFGAESDYLRYLGFHTAAYTFTDPDIHRRLGDRFAITDTIDCAVGLYAIRNGRIPCSQFIEHRILTFRRIHERWLTPPTPTWAG